MVSSGRSVSSGFFRSLPPLGYSGAQEIAPRFLFALEPARRFLLTLAINQQLPDVPSRSSAVLQHGFDASRRLLRAAGLIVAYVTLWDSPFYWRSAVPCTQGGVDSSSFALACAAVLAPSRLGRLTMACVSPDASASGSFNFDAALTVRRQPEAIIPPI